MIICHLEAGSSDFFWHQLQISESVCCKDAKCVIQFVVMCCDV